MESDILLQKFFVILVFLVSCSLVQAKSNSNSILISFVSNATAENYDSDMQEFQAEIAAAQVKVDEACHLPVFSFGVASQQTSVSSRFSGADANSNLEGRIYSFGDLNWPFFDWYCMKQTAFHQAEYQTERARADRSNIQASIYAMNTYIYTMKLHLRLNLMEKWLVNLEAARAHIDNADYVINEWNKRVDNYKENEMARLTAELKHVFGREKAEAHEQNIDRYIKGLLAKRDGWGVPWNGVNAFPQFFGVNVPALQEADSDQALEAALAMSPELRAANLAVADGAAEASALRSPDVRVSAHARGEKYYTEKGRSDLGYVGIEASFTPWNPTRRRQAAQADIRTCRSERQRLEVERSLADKLDNFYIDYRRVVRNFPTVEVEYFRAIGGIEEQFRDASISIESLRQAEGVVRKYTDEIHERYMIVYKIKGLIGYPLSTDILDDARTGSL